MPGPLDGGGDGLVPDGRTPHTRAWGPFLRRRAGLSPRPRALSLGRCPGSQGVQDESLAGPLRSGQAITCPSRVRGGQALHGLCTPEREPVLRCAGQRGICGWTAEAESGSRSVASDSL